MHLLNRSVKRATLFSTPGDYLAFEEVLWEALQRIPLRLLAFCVMPNHWHFVAWPSEDGQVSRFLHWLTTAHACRWHASRGTRGTGAVYQGRFKSFPVASDGHLLRVMRYVERNALRANLVARAEDWPWGSLWHRVRGDSRGYLSESPVPLPTDWVDVVNQAETDEELAALRRCAQRGAPLGPRPWTLATASEWGLQSSLRANGRPRRGATLEIPSIPIEPDGRRDEPGPP